MNAFLNDESCLELRRGDHAFIGSAKPAIAVLRDPVIDKIANKRRHNNKDVKQRPKTIEPPGDLESSTASIIHIVTGQQNYTHQLFFAELMFFELSLTKRRLQGSKPESRGGIVSDHKLYRSITKITYPIEENNGRIYRIRCTHPLRCCTACAGSTTS